MASTRMLCYSCHMLGERWLVYQAKPFNLLTTWEHHVPHLSHQGCKKNSWHKGANPSITGTVLILNQAHARNTVLMTERQASKHLTGFILQCYTFHFNIKVFLEMTMALSWKLQISLKRVSPDRDVRPNLYRAGAVCSFVLSKHLALQTTINKE